MDKIIEKKTSFAPTIQTKWGRTITPKGYEWVLGFAFAGCQWAIDKANTPEFKESMLKSLREEAKTKCKQEVKRLEEKLQALHTELEQLNSRQLPKGYA